MYATGDSWKSWMCDFRFGTLVVLPQGDLRRIADDLRLHFDPNSARTCAAHLTLTQPFSYKPTPNDFKKIAAVLSQIPSFNATIGPVVRSPNKRLLWMDVNPKDTIVQIRDWLHGLGCFRTDLPLTKGFIPHLTISEAQRDPDEVYRICDELNSKLLPWQLKIDSIQWIVPNNDFEFLERKSFSLGRE